MTQETSIDNTTELKEIAVFLLDTQNPILNQFGDFGDQGIELISKSTTDINASFKFTKYNIIENQEFPTDGELSKIHGIYLTGSRSDSFDNKDWILNLIKFLKHVLNNYKHIKMVGICFGHQVLSIAIGLTTVRNDKGWEMGLTNIKLNDQLNDQLFKELIEKTTDSFNIVEMHQDIVLEDENSLSILQKNQIQIIGSTDICKYQGFYKPNQLLTFQGHPEFNMKCTGIIVDSRYSNGLLTESFYNGVVKRNNSLKADEEVLGRVIVSFLDS